MTTNGAVTGIRRRSQAEAARLVSEFARSGLRRKEFCAAHGLKVHTLDAWRKRVALSGAGEEMVPVEIVAGGVPQARASVGPMGRSGPFRVVLTTGLRIEVEPGFDAAELRRLIAALDSVPLPTGLRPAV